MYIYIYIHIYVYIYQYMSQIEMSCFNGRCKWHNSFMAHVKMSHVMSHIEMKHGTRRNESRHMWEYVMSQTLRHSY